MSAHTPGPWSIHDARELLLRKGDSKYHELADGECEANACLIAAAPDLLEQMILALPYVESALEDRGYKPNAVKIRTEAIRAAIAKAYGATP